MRVLIADDENVISCGIERVLRKHLIDCTIVNNGNDAIRELSSGTYDVCVLDYSMPGKNGIEVLQAKKALGIDTKVIMISGYNDIGVLEEAEKDINLFFSKSDLDLSALPSFVKSLKFAKNIKRLATAE